MYKNNKGFSLMELAISIGLIAVLLGVVAAGGGMMNKCRVQREVQAVENLRLAAQNFLSGKNLTYAGVTVASLKTGGYLPLNFDPAGSNSFGGDYTVGPNGSDNTKIDIVLANIPASAATALSETLQAKADATAYDNTSKIWKATF
ncbi:MAG: prepilin-type N-terminal cleavage/methylation domain-containing protein [Candidatus Omnitrophota bacterium]